jgi:hypothetical protein
MHPLEFIFKYSRDTVPSIEEWQRIYDSYQEMFQEVASSKNRELSTLDEVDKIRQTIMSKDMSDGYMARFETMVHQIRNLITILEDEDFNIRKHDYKSQLRIIRISFNTLQGEWWKHIHPIRRYK